jgi:hypothetical protein
MKYIRLITKLLIVILPFFAVYFSMPANPIIKTQKACAFSQWGPNCPGVDAHHQSCPSGNAYPANYPACIDSVGITVPIVVHGLTGNNGSIKIKAHAKGPGSSGWDNACVAQNVTCLLREADSTDQAVSSDGTYNFYIDPIGCTSGNCDDNFSITAQFDTNGTKYTCQRTDDQTVNLNKNGQDYTTPPVGITCSLPATPTPTPRPTSTPIPTPTRAPTPTPTRPTSTPIPTPTRTPSVCPVLQVTNVRISCPSCGL